MRRPYLDHMTVEFCTAMKVGRSVWRVVYATGRVLVLRATFLPDHYEPQV
ncbi:MAG: hypothetical protein JWL61_4966 [Gemmatimonadetes bacterium]|nr:hypothetical protein [Gemmatimonadota bacterium]